MAQTTEVPKVTTLHGAVVLVKTTKSKYQIELNGLTIWRRTLDGAMFFPSTILCVKDL